MEQPLTYTLCHLLGLGEDVRSSPAVTLTAVQRPLVEVKVAKWRLHTTPLKGQEIVI